MCNAFSCILKSDLSIVPNPRPDVHSHEAQARAAGILDSIGSDAYQRVECVPEGFDYASDPMTWTVRVDEERRASWVDENWPEIEDRVRRAAARWIASRGIRDDGSYVVGYDETRIVLSGSKATITVKDGRVYTCGTSSPTITVSGGYVYIHDSSSPTITVSGGDVYVFSGSSSPKITRVAKE